MAKKQTKRKKKSKIKEKVIYYYSNLWLFDISIIKKNGKKYLRIKAADLDKNETHLLIDKLKEALTWF